MLRLAGLQRGHPCVAEREERGGNAEQPRRTLPSSSSSSSSFRLLTGTAGPARARDRRRSHAAAAAGCLFALRVRLIKTLLGVVDSARLARPAVQPLVVHDSAHVTEGGRVAKHEQGRTPPPSASGPRLDVLGHAATRMSHKATPPPPHTVALPTIGERFIKRFID